VRNSAGQQRTEESGKPRNAAREQAPRTEEQQDASTTLAKTPQEQLHQAGKHEDTQATPGAHPRKSGNTESGGSDDPSLRSPSPAGGRSGLAPSGPESQADGETDNTSMTHGSVREGTTDPEATHSVSGAPMAQDTPGALTPSTDEKRESGGPVEEQILTEPLVAWVEQRITHSQATELAKSVAHLPESERGRALEKAKNAALNSELNGPDGVHFHSTAPNDLRTTVRAEDYADIRLKAVELESGTRIRKDPTSGDIYVPHDNERTLEIQHGVSPAAMSLSAMAERPADSPGRYWDDPAVGSREQLESMQTPEGRAAYRALVSAIEGTIPDLQAWGSKLSAGQVSTVEYKAFLDRAFSGTAIEKALADDRELRPFIESGHIRWMGASKPGQALPDFEIKDGNRIVVLDITGPSESSRRSHEAREYYRSLPNPAQHILQYPQMDSDQVTRAYRHGQN
jgi:hypothetical protein